MIVKNYIINRQYDYPEDHNCTSGHVLVRRLEANDQPGALRRRYRFYDQEDECRQYIRAINAATELSKTRTALI